jgi:hypothetical protein
MFSLLRKTPSLRMTAEDSILLLLDFLNRKGIRRIPESELHRLVFAVRSLLPTPMRFVHQPTTYSNELFDCLKKLERNRLVDELVYVHDGWVPKHLYEVTRIGHLRAVELEDRILTFRALPLQDLMDSIIAAAKQRDLLPSLHD